MGIAGVLGAAVLAVPAISGGATTPKGDLAGHHAIAPCANGQIVSWLNTAGNGYAGGIGYELQFTNVSTRACSLSGFPGVSAVSFAHHQIGSAATRDGSAGRTVDVRPAATVRATLLIVDTGNFPRSICRPTTASGLRVYAPNQTYSDVIPFPFSTCSKLGTASLMIQSMTH